MQQSEINFMNMSDATLAGLEAEKVKWENKIPIVTAINTTKAFRAELTGLSADQASLTTTGLKVNFANMVELTMDIVKRVRPYALATNNKALLAIIDFSKSDLTHGKQIETINKCKIVLQEGKNNLAALADYELRLEMLDALESAINGVALLSGNRDSIIGARKTATDGIPVLIARMRLQLEILDDLVPALIDDEKLVQTYKNNRRIIDR